jgi:hypothetical protein
MIMEIIMYMVAVFVTSVVCGIGFRIRGGLWNTVIVQYIPWGSTTARLVAWATPTAVLGTLWYGLTWYYMPILILAVWLGCLLPWFGSLDMGRNQHSWGRDFAVISLRGVAWTLPASVVFLFVGALLPACGLLLCGAAMGIWYEAGWRTPSMIPQFQQGSELGELYFGLMFGLTLALLALM